MSLISIIIPAYNASKTINETLDSALNQSYQNIEIVIVDDCSHDNTYDIIRKRAESDKRIKCFKNKENLGVSKTRNYAVSKAEGEWIAFLDSDDLWVSDKLEKQLAVAEETGADIIYCSYGIIDGDGKKKCNDFIVSKTTDYDRMLERSVVSCSTAMIRREIMNKYKFSSEYAHEDYALWMEMFSDGLTAAADQTVLAYYRVTKGTRSSDKFKAAHNRWIIYRKCLRMSIFKSIKCIIRYTFKAFKKYRQI